MRNQRGSAFVQTAVRSPAKSCPNPTHCEETSLVFLVALAEAMDSAA